MAYRVLNPSLLYLITVMYCLAFANKIHKIQKLSYFTKTPPLLIVPTTVGTLSTLATGIVPFPQGIS
jgi:hypothetical protein